MADPSNPRSTGPSAEGPGTRTGSEIWVRRIVLALGLVVIILIAYSVLSALLPRWWAQRVAAQVDGRISVGIFWGLFYGFVFSFVPLLVLWQVRRSFLSWPWRIAIVVVAVLLATPNWLTLSLRVGISKAAEDGWLVLVTRAPGFQWSSLFGAIAGAAAALGLIGILMTGRRRKEQVSRLEGRLAEHDPRKPGSDEPNDHHREEPHA